MLNFSEYEFIVEKSIGSEETRMKWYSDMDKKLFYKIVNIDPTSVRKKDFSKLGKYSKWLLIQYKKGKLDSVLNDKDLIDELNYFLFIFSTKWFVSKCLTAFHYGGITTKSYKDIDILKYDFDRFINKMIKYVNQYKEETEDSKFDVVFSDEKVSVLVPLNFTASYETAKNTQWCSQTFSGYSMWNSMAILFRIIPKEKVYDKLKLTWERGGNSSGRWMLACSKYPEIVGYDLPFEKTFTDGKTVDNWEKLCINKKGDSDSLDKNIDEIQKTMYLLSEQAKDCIMEYYIKYRK